MNAQRPTRRQLVEAIEELSSIVQQMHCCYQNDVQPDRAGQMELLNQRASKVSEILWSLEA